METNDNKTETPAHSGLAGRIARGFINSKLTLLVVLASVALGLAAVGLLPREEEPQIKVPMIDVLVTMPGASAQEVEQRVTRPMEKLLWEIPGVEYVYSTSSPCRSLVIVRFKVGEDVEKSLVRLNQKLQANFDRIPQGVGQPLVKPHSIDDVPVLALTLHSRTLDHLALRRVAAQVEDAVKAAPEVAETKVIGGARRQMRVLLDPARMASRGVAAAELVPTLEQANAQLSAGPLTAGDREIRVETGGFLADAAEVGAVVVGVHAGRPVHLREVAQVVDGGEEPAQYVFFGAGGGADKGAFEPAVTLTVAKRPGANAITVVRSVLARMEALKGTVIPGDVQVTVTRNYGETAKEKSDELLFHMLLAVLAVSLLILLVLGWREALVVAVAIPSTLALTLLVFYLYGYTLNRITLFALIFSIGILVDDAIVVIENIVRHMRLPENKERPLAEVAVEAVGEVGNPTILATWAVIAAILPMASVGGLMGPYMRPIPVGASAAMFFSLLVAFIVTPWAAVRILRLRKQKNEQKETKGTKEEGEARTVERDAAEVAAGKTKTEEQKKEGDETPARKEDECGAGACPSTSSTMSTPSTPHPEDFLTRLYRHVMGPMIALAHWRWAFLFSIGGLLLAAMALVPLGWVRVKMLPFDNKSEFQVILNMPEGSSLEHTAAAAREIAAAVRVEPEVTDVELYAGTASPFNFNGLVRHYFMRGGANVADLQVNLRPKGERRAKSHEIAKRVRPAVAEIAKRYGARVAVAEVPPGPPVLQTLVAEVYGPDEASRLKLAEEIRDIFKRTPEVVDVDWYVEAEREKVRFVVDKEKAALHGISEAEVARTLRLAVEGAPAGLLHLPREKEDVAIVLELPRQAKAAPEALLNLNLRGAGGGLVPLRELVRMERVPADRSLYHKNLLPVTYVIGDVAGKTESPAYAIFAMNRELAKLDGRRFGGRVEALPVFNLAMPSESGAPAVKWDGEWQITLEVFRDLGTAFAAVCVLIYILMVGWFRSFLTPFIVMAAIPFSLIGILPAHGAMGAFFTATSMIGFMAGAGIVVRNSIILIDFIELRRSQGMPLAAAVVDAGAVRFRPMLLTALAVVCGAAVILADPIFQGLALSLMAGEIASLLVSRMAVPVLYFMAFKGDDKQA
jgi:multidrug efflux pump subunit AcrB